MDDYAMRQPWNVHSGTEVVFLPGERRAAERIVQHFFGRHFRLSEFAGLAGAPDDARVEIGVLGSALYLEVYDPRGAAYHAHFYLCRKAGSLTLRNEGFSINVRTLQRHGLGLQMFYRQARNAAALGIDSIVTTAGRRSHENGYYTWPRYGFDGILPGAVLEILPAHLRSSRTLLDLMATEQGRVWWRRHGVPICLRFDLTPGSRSQYTLIRYIRAKSRDVARLRAGWVFGQVLPLDRTIDLFHTFRL